MVRRFLIIATSALLADLATKEVAEHLLGEHGVVQLSGRLVLTLVWNMGSAGGVSIGPFTSQINIVVTLLALVLVITVVKPLAMVHPLATVSLGLVSGGATGNLLSMLAGPPGVADFIGIAVRPETTVVANVADFSLWTGASMLVPVGATLFRMVRNAQATGTLSARR